MKKVLSTLVVTCSLITLTSSSFAGLLNQDCDFLIKYMHKRTGQTMDDFTMSIDSNNQMTLDYKRGDDFNLPSEDKFVFKCNQITGRGSLVGTYTHVGAFDQKTTTPLTNESAVMSFNNQKNANIVLVANTGLIPYREAATITY